MSLIAWPNVCPKCSAPMDSADVDGFHEIGRIEADEFGPDDPPTDRAIYRCEACRHEWEQ